MPEAMHAKPDAPAPRPRRVLFTTHQYNDDGANGQSLRLNNLVHHLDRSRVTPLFFALNPLVLDEARLAAEYEAHRRVTLAPRPHSRLSRAALMVAGSHWFVLDEFPELPNVLRPLVRDWRVDLLVDVGGDSIATYGRTNLGTRVACDSIDSRVLWARRDLAAVNGWWPALRARFVLRANKAYQRNAFAGTQFVTLVSDEDVAAVRETNPRDNIITLPNGVDVDRYAPLPRTGALADIVFEGNMGFPPNVDAAVHFVREVLPRVLATRPDAHFWIVGKGPAPEVAALAGPNVTVTGFVDDVRPWLARAAVFVCPMRLGAGIKNKVLQAWSMQLPVVATPATLPGLSATDGETLLVGRTPQEFADAVLRVLGDGGLAARLGAAARAHVVEHFSWRSRADALTELIEAACA